MNKKKPMIIRIIILIVATAMIIGIIIGSFSSLFVNAATIDPKLSVTVESFTTGGLRSAVDKAKGSIDQNNIQKLEVLSGTLNTSDFQALQSYSNCKEIFLDKTTSEDGVIPDYVLSGKGLTYISLPQGIKKIGNGSFSGCGQLTDIVIPDTLTEIGNRAFESCNALTKITLPSGVISVDECAFRSCNNLNEIVIKSKQAPKIASEVFPKTVKIIADEDATGFDEWKDYKVELSGKSDALKVEETTKITEETTVEETTVAETSEKVKDVVAVSDNTKTTSLSTWEIVCYSVVSLLALIGLVSICIFLVKKIALKKKQ